MAYEYYCLGCGRKLNQDAVLFDMQYLLTADTSKRFHILKFRMNQAELKKMIRSGKPLENGWRQCQLTWEEIIAVISNGNNLVDPAIAELTMDEIIEYMDQDVESAFSWGKDSPFWFPEMDEEKEEEKTKVSYEPPRSILAIEKKYLWNTDRVFARSALKADFEVLLRLLDIEKPILTFGIKEENEIDNENQPVLVGFMANLPGVGHLCVENRVCPKCGCPVFKYAGTAKHWSIGVVGYNNAGATSTVVALAHYIENRLSSDLENEVWKDVPRIRDVATAELLDASPWLLADMNNYALGIAPAKTLTTRRTDAYSTTFRIKDKARNRYHLLSVHDSPGELCPEERGGVDRPLVMNNFPFLLTCDLYLMCVDSQILTCDSGRLMRIARALCGWHDDFLKMRESHIQEPGYVPMMLLITKCPELEAVQEVKEKQSWSYEEQLYLLRTEKQAIAQNRICQFIADRFHQLEGYHAVMRCSPYGYRAPSSNDIKYRERSPQTPTPKNVDVLMRWILSVTGCIPVEGDYAMTPSVPPMKLRNFYVSRSQMRHQNPGCSSNEKQGSIDDVQEAMARCVLFENPGRLDRMLVTACDRELRIIQARAASKLKPDTNNLDD